jgi:glycosyltransferase involved in cell wall biosynthesis
VTGRIGPRISVVVPTFNRCERLHRVLSALAEQDIDESFEVVVVSDGSTDGTDGYLESDRLPLPVVAIRQANGGPAAARNAGTTVASGDLIVFLDDDVVPEPALVAAHREAHRRLGSAVVVIGPMLDPPDHVMSPWVAWEQAMLAKQYDDMNAGRYEATSRQFYTGNASILRRHLVEVGGFDATFRRAEDVELAFRLDQLGLTFHFEPTARGYHYAERSYDSWKAAAYTYGRNEVQFARRPREWWRIDFARRSYLSHHSLIRLLVRRAVRSRRWRHALIASNEFVVRRRVAPPILARYALSLIYAVEFFVGLSDELGSEAEFERVIIGGGRIDAV